MQFPLANSLFEGLFGGLLPKPFLKNKATVKPPANPQNATILVNSLKAKRDVSEEASLNL